MRRPIALAAMSRAICRAGANPGSVAVSSYWPSGRLWKSNCPSESVCVSLLLAPSECEGHAGKWKTSRILN